MNESLEKESIASVIGGDDIHYLDHLAPLSNHFRIPLYTDRDEIVELCDHFYPDTLCRLETPLDLFPSITANYSHIISCLPKKALQSCFFLSDRKVKTIWLPHGYSDKDNLLPCKDENSILSYGPAFERKIVDVGFQGKFHRLGNFRLQMYQRYKDFYDQLFKKELPISFPTILYAPTWEDYEDNSSISSLDYLTKYLPDDIHLLVKLHPNTIVKDPFLWERKKWQQAKKNITFIDHIPTIYPILDKVDLLITDYSSIAYDMLYFQKPMLFLLPDKKKPTDIHKTGDLIKDNKEIFPIVYKRLEEKPFISEKQSMYKSVFGG